MIKSYLAFFLLISNFIMSQGINALVIYDTKLAEDNFSFQSKLYFNEYQSTYISKQSNKAVWIVEEKTSDDGGFNLNYNKEEIYSDTIGHVVIGKINSPLLKVRDFCKKSEPLFYKDSVNIKWKIKKGTKKIGNLTCLKAVSTFRGRKYEAWFTPEIPISFGPWKFKGLPGLIVELQDTKKEVMIQMVSVNLNHQAKNISLSNNTESETHFKEFHDCLDSEWEISSKKTIAKFAQMQAESPSLEIELEIPKRRPATELVFDK